MLKVPALAHPTASMIVFTETLAALAADVEAARVLCAPYLFMLIPAFSRTFFNQRAIVSVDTGLKGLQKQLGIAPSG